MALTFTIGGQSFGALNNTAGRKAMSWLPQALEADVMRFHIKGANGNFILRGGKDGGKITCRFRYIGSITDVYGFFFADQGSWYNTAITITGPGKTYSQCNLDKGGMRISKEPVAVGRGTVGQVYMDVEASFTSDGAS